MLTPIKEYSEKTGIPLRSVYRAIENGTLKLGYKEQVIETTRTQKIKCIVED